VGTVRSSALSWVIQWQRAVRWATLGLAGDCPLWAEHHRTQRASKQCLLFACCGGGTFASS